VYNDGPILVEVEALCDGGPTPQGCRSCAAALRSPRWPRSCATTAQNSKGIEEPYDDGPILGVVEELHDGGPKPGVVEEHDRGLTPEVVEGMPTAI